VVHRDLKPSNILLSPKGPRIIDFGIAWATGASTLTHVGTAVGSPGFLAPEQVRGAAVTPATDVFALGATLAYAATQDSPFGQGSSEVMLYRVVHEEPHLHGVPDALAPLVRACLAKDPEERPSTLQLSLRLKEIAAREAQGMADARPPAPRTDPDRPTGRLAEQYAEQRTQRRPGTTPPPRTGGTNGGSRSGSRPAPVRNTGRTGNRPAPRSGAGRPGPRTTGTGRRPANPRLLRQRLFVFVVVTLLVALGIAAAQGCQGPSRGLDDGPRGGTHQEQRAQGRLGTVGKNTGEPVADRSPGGPAGDPQLSGRPVATA
jgi:hypothetical protein